MDERLTSIIYLISGLQKNTIIIPKRIKVDLQNIEHACSAKGLNVDIEIIEVHSVNRDSLPDLILQKLNA